MIFFYILIVNSLKAPEYTSSYSIPDNIDYGLILKPLGDNNRYQEDPKSVFDITSTSTVSSKIHDENLTSEDEFSGAFEWVGRPEIHRLNTSDIKIRKLSSRIGLRSRGRRKFRHGDFRQPFTQPSRNYFGHKNGERQTSYYVSKSSGHLEDMIQITPSSSTGVMLKSPSPYLKFRRFTPSRRSNVLKDRFLTNASSPSRHLFKRRLASRSGYGGGNSNNRRFGRNYYKNFPPSDIIAKIGSKYNPPCHGPECHDHHKGVVKFWWKKVIKPKKPTKSIPSPYYTLQNSYGSGKDGHIGGGNDYGHIGGGNDYGNIHGQSNGYNGHGGDNGKTDYYNGAYRGDYGAGNGYGGNVNNDYDYSYGSGPKDYGTYKD